MWFPVNSEPSGEEEEEDLQAEAGSLNIEPGTELDYGKVFTVCVCVCVYTFGFAHLCVMGIYCVQHVKQVYYLHL